MTEGNKDQSLKGLTRIAQMNFGRLFYEVKTLRFSAVLFFNSLREWFFQPRIKQITRIKDQSLKGLTRIFRLTPIEMIYTAAPMNFGELFYEVKRCGSLRLCGLLQISCTNIFSATDDTDDTD